MRVASIDAGKQNSGQFKATTVFKAGDTLSIRAHVVDSGGNSVSGASVTIMVLKPDGSTQCTSTDLTGSDGNMMMTCGTSLSSPWGVWDARLRTVSKTGYGTDMNQSTMDRYFTIE